MKNYENKKSQAAVEFLITYGWAILGVIVVIGALAYFGVFNTDRFINDECSFGTQLYCEDFILTASGQLRINIRNNFGQEISITGARIYYEGALIGGLNPCFPTPLPIGSGVLASSTCNLGMTFPQNDKIKLNALIYYRRNVGGAPLHNITGTIIATAQ